MPPLTSLLDSADSDVALAAAEALAADPTWRPASALRPRLEELRSVGGDGTSSVDELLARL